MSVAGLPAAAPRRASTAFVAGGAVLAALTAVVFHRVGGELWRTWNTNENYSHGPLVPLTAAALVALRWGRLRELPVRGDARGLVLLGVGCAAHVLGVRADLFALECWSLLPVLLGLVLTFLGLPAARMLAFPILYLAFMMTFPPIVMNQLSYGLKELAVRAATQGAELLGVTLQRDGMTLYLATGELRVENPCSGLRSLLALLATGTLFAYFQPGGGWRRFVMLVASVPFAILGNAVRLLLLIVAAHYRDVPWATGAFHDITGYVLYAVSLGAMLGLRALLTPRTCAKPVHPQEVAA